jgi:hypothetical protein
MNRRGCLALVADGGAQCPSCHVPLFRRPGADVLAVRLTGYRAYLQRTESSKQLG